MVKTEVERVGVHLTIIHPEFTVPFLPALRNYTISHSAGTSPVGVTLIFETGAPLVRVGANELEVTVPSRDVTQRGFQVAVDQAFSMGMERLGRHVIHASAVATRDSVVAMWGQSGAGKTTLARGMRSQYGGHIISNGALVLSMREGVVLAHGASKRFAKVRASSNEPEAVSPANGSAYESKHEVNIAEWGAEEVALPLPVAMFCIVRAVRGLKRSHIVPIDRKRMLPKLYQEMSRSILGTEALIFSPDGKPILGFPSLSTSAGHASRYNMSARLLDVGVHATGPLDDLTAQIWRDFERKSVLC